MTKRILLLTALLASTAAIGSAFAAGHFARLAGDPVAAVIGGSDESDAVVLASGDARDHDRRRSERHARRRHHDDDDHHGRRRHHDDDDDDHHGRDGRRGSALAPTGPSDPATPVPQNGLFGGKSRPKVEVQ